MHLLEKRPVLKPELGVTSGFRMEVIDNLQSQTHRPLQLQPQDRIIPPLIKGGKILILDDRNP